MYQCFKTLAVVSKNEMVRGGLLDSSCRFHVQLSTPSLENSSEFHIISYDENRWVHLLHVFVVEKKYIYRLQSNLQSHINQNLCSASLILGSRSQRTFSRGKSFIIYRIDIHSSLATHAKKQANGAVPVACSVLCYFLLSLQLRHVESV
jgi:hypothetical protein